MRSIEAFGRFRFQWLCHRPSKPDEKHISPHRIIPLCETSNFGGGGEGGGGCVVEYRNGRGSPLASQTMGDSRLSARANC